MRLAARPGGFAAAAVGLLLVDGALRLLVGGPYPGATALLLAACGMSLFPFLPAAVGTPSIRLALLPVLALGSFSVLLTTVSIVGVPLTELTIRLAVAALVVALGVAAAALPRREAVSWPARREGIAIAVLVGIVGFSLAASWDVLDPFPPPGSDWAYYLLYADEVESQGHLLIDNPHAVGEVRSLGNYPGIGAVYGSVRILDGVSSRALADGLVLAMVVAPLAVYAAVAALWGAGAGLVAAAAYAVSPIHLEPLYWHGLATTLALAFLPVTILALGLMYRGRRGWRTVSLLGFSLAGVAAMHSVSAGIVALVLAIILAGDAALGLARRRGTPLRSWWHAGMSRPVLAGVGVGAIIGAGVIVHLRLLAVDAGSPVSYRFFDREWIDLDTIDYYFSWLFLALTGASLALVLLSRVLRRDAALAPIGALALASVLVSQSWRLHVPFEYRRVVYYLAVAMVMVIGVASVRLGRRWLVAGGYAVVLLALAQGSIGLRLPERLLEEPEPRAMTVDALEAFGLELERGGTSGRPLVVADRCLGIQVPYFLRAPTLIVAEEWQVGFTNGLAVARDARTLLEGGPEGRRLASELGVRYAVVDPTCTPDAAATLGGKAIVDRADLVIVELS
ncbi:MAG: hypothetical protein ACRDNY_03430 [Gaiellaceae bacterium]